ncbi:MAG: TRAP transporter permease [Thermodesulfobacteriota bacterium]
MEKVSKWVISLLAAGLSLFHIWGAIGGVYPPFVQYPVHLGVVLMLAFLTYRAWKVKKEPGQVEDEAPRPRQVPWYDWLLALAVVPVFGYLVVYHDYVVERWPLTASFPLTFWEMTFALAAMLLIFEATRRIMGWPLIIISIVFLLYCRFGNAIQFSPALHHRGFSVRHILDYMYLTDNGIWGPAVAVAATYMVLFVIFGAFVEKGGAASFFIELSLAIAGKTKGGPAKVAIFSSGLVGMITGSTTANVYTTGVFTIPMMKKLGYRSSFAGAVEALASNGGQIMPPVMGAAAFIMASYLGIPYTRIAISCAIPAIIYFVALYIYIHIEADKVGLKGLSEEEVPRLGEVVFKGLHLISPLLALIVFLLLDLSPLRAAFYAILVTVAASWIRKDTRMGPREIWGALVGGGLNNVFITTACAVVGYIIGTFILTGLGINITSLVISLSQGIFFLSLVFIAIACLILGMGMNTTAAYILVSVIGVPTLTKQGVDPLVAHVFCFYVACLANITPPVCLGVYAGAAIAEADMWQTGWDAVKMGLVAYILPFMVAYNPAILLKGPWSTIFMETATATLGTIFIASSIQGWLWRKYNWPERIMALLGGLGMFWPGLTTNIAGVILVSVIVYFQRYWTPKAELKPTA